MRSISILLFCLIAPSLAARSFDSVSVKVAPGGGELVHRYADLLKDQLRRRCGVKIAESDREAALRITLSAASAIGDTEAPTAANPGPEGFRLRTLPEENAMSVHAIGVDERGVLYAVGELLRRMDFDSAAIELSERLDIRSAPAFEIRGTEVSQGATMREITGAREWTEDEWQQAVIGYALAGANTFGMGHVGPSPSSHYQFVKSLGLDVLTSFSPNVGTGPPEWQATEAIGRTNYLCPSVPEAREHIIKQAEALFKSSTPVDYIRFYSGDGGGCECERCAPYGATYIRMCETIASIIHHYHPETRIFATNQKLDNVGDQAIFDYLREKPSAWLDALCYGPGSNAMGWMPGRRQDHRMDLFRYPAFGPMDRYLRQIVHELPPTIDLVFFTDLTHWVYSQYGLMDHELLPDRNGNVPPHWGHDLYDAKPDAALAQVYNRRTFHARPRAYYNVFRETMRYGIGDVTYSEGHHDHFNQWMWQRLMWSPETRLADIIAQYAFEFFGEQAAPQMAEAIVLLEKNLSSPIGENKNIDAVYDLVETAGKRMPEWRRERDYLWRMYMQRAALDGYIRLSYMRQAAMKMEIEREAERGMDSHRPDRYLRRILKVFGTDGETRAMRDLRAEAERLGGESAAIYGVRNEGLFNLEQDFVGLGWYRRETERAMNAQAADQRATLRLIARYEDAGEGGFYDDAGNPARSPRLVKGWPYGDGGFSGANRVSQRTMAYTTDEAEGVAFQYHELDPNAAYRVRVTLVRPRYLPRFGKFQHQKSQSIYADDIALAENLELPEYESEFFEFDIPREATADGKLKVWFKKAEGIGEGLPSQVTVWRNTGGWGTLVSEIWLMKRGGSE